jgi:uncharacterized membrane protein
MSLALTLHLLGAVVWVGGMFFAYVCLRPVAAADLQPPARLRLWSGVFGRFFPWVWAAVGLLLATGYWMLFAVFGGFAGAGVHIHLMQGLGLLMMLLYGHLFFAPFRRLKAAVAAENWPAGGAALGQIRRIVAINLSLGLIVVAIGSGGRYL